MPSSVTVDEQKQLAALNRAQYEARKSQIGALEDAKGQLKDALDNQNAIMREAKAEARNLQRQIDEIDEAVRVLKNPQSEVLG